MSENSRQTVAMRAAGVLLLLTLALVLGMAQPGQLAPAESPPAVLPNGAASTPAPDSPRHKQLVDDSDELLTLAIALKGEVDKTNKDMLSLNVIRKADAIEKLAHRLRDRLRTAGAGT